MCGIAGIIRLNKKPIRQSKLKTMTEALVHRGPDGEGHWLNQKCNVGFGHRRLSIIDLTESASQPMHYSDSRLTITYNGEIYNYIEIKKELKSKGYKFITSSDTEVILASYHYWGKNCLARFDGMFAFAIWDEFSQETFCARDRFGEKPFFYYQNPEEIVFASEMKAIFSIGISKEVKEDRLFNYIAHNQREDFRHPESTFYKNIHQLEPGHYLIISSENKNIEKVKYWNLNTNTNFHITFNEAVEQFYNLFETSIKRRLRSDVAVGSSLSGGLDSSFIVSLIQKCKPENQKQFTFSARYKDYDQDEGEFIDALVKKYDIKSYATWPSDLNMINEIDKIFHHQEEPFGSSSVVAQWEVMKLAKEMGVTVLLDGQGADEILAGYNGFYPIYHSELLGKNPLLFLKEYKAFKNLHGGYPNKTSAISLLAFKSFFPSFFIPLLKIKSKLLNHNSLHLKDINRDFLIEHVNKPLPYVAQNNLNQSMKFNLLQKGLGELLRKGDRNAMAFSVETRLPYLNHDLVEFLFTLPSSFKINSGWSKYLLRKSMEPHVPKKITWRKSKIGFATPQKKWFQNEKVKELVDNAKTKLIEEKIIKNRDVNIDGWQLIMASKLYR
jgi:asparagine synthase (glutamine-hydrolysing)